MVQQDGKTTKNLYFLDDSGDQLVKLMYKKPIHSSPLIPKAKVKTVTQHSVVPFSWQQLPTLKK